MIRAAQERAARKRYREMAPVLNEQSRRRFVALEAQALGRGGVSLMVRISSLARSTIYQGLSDIRNKVFTSGRRIRKEGGGRKKKAIQVIGGCRRTRKLKDCSARTRGRYVRDPLR
jgi:hypothetical protein